jgi:hypothetical protein
MVSNTPKRDGRPEREREGGGGFSGGKKLGRVSTTIKKKSRREDGEKLCFKVAVNHISSRNWSCSWLFTWRPLFLSRDEMSLKTRQLLTVHEGSSFYIYSKLVLGSIIK